MELLAVFDSVFIVDLFGIQLENSIDSAPHLVGRRPSRGGGLARVEARDRL